MTSTIESLNLVELTLSAKINEWSLLEVQQLVPRSYAILAPDGTGNFVIMGGLGDSGMDVNYFDTATG